MTWKDYGEIALAVMGICVLVVVHALVGALATWRMFTRKGAVVTHCPMCGRSASHVIESNTHTDPPV